MQWAYLLLVLAALLAVVRIVLALRKARSQSTHDDWDARLVKNLRAAGGNSFTPYEVDFFFNLPDEPACAALRGSRMLGRRAQHRSDQLRIGVFRHGTDLTVPKTKYPAISIVVSATAS